MRETANPPPQGQRPGRNIEKAIGLPFSFAPDTVLIVDDNEVVRDVIADFLDDEYPYLFVETASDGFEALDRINVRIPSMLITGILMSGMDGITLLKALHEKGISLPTLAMSGYWAKEAFEDSLAEVGITAAETILFLEKPFQIERLSSLIERLREAGPKE